MPTNDGWDWPWMLFTGTILLGFSEREFWEMTPLKFRTLWDCQREYDEMRYSSSGNNKSGRRSNVNKVQDGFIDQIDGW
jgi:hypothetical protein